MKSEQTTKRGAVRTALSIGVLGLALMATSVWAEGTTHRVLVPQQDVLPFYVTGLGHTGFGEDDYVIAAFYYPPGDIPADYSLWEQPVWAAPVGVETPNAEGFMVWSDKIPYYPVQQELQLVPGAPMAVWFVPVNNFANGLPDSQPPIPPMTWTVNSMKAEGAIVGWADFYIDSWQPGPGHHTIVVSGVMEDGRTFRVESTSYCKVQFGP